MNRSSPGEDELLPASAERRSALKRISALSLAPLLPFASGAASAATAVHALPRHALVIGNSRYAMAPLSNPTNDAKAIASALKQAGFAVDLQLDARKAAMEAAIRGFAGNLGRQTAVGLFYFAGHGLQLNWHNFLVPVDAALNTADDVPRQAVDITALLEGLNQAKNPMNIIILDACRDNPFESNIKSGKGLNQMDAPIGTLLAYATAPGNTASDGSGTNGLYTENLLREMRKPEAKIEDIFKRVRLNVRRASNGQQIPWESTSLEDDFYFVPPPELKKLSQEEIARQFAEEFAVWETAQKGGGVAPIEDYMRRYPSGRFTELAQVRLDKLLAMQGEKKVQVVSVAANPFSKGTALANMKYRVGDRYEYRVTDMMTRVVQPSNVDTITAVTDNEIVYNEGKLVTDLLGNVRRRPDGAEFSPNQVVVTEYSVGKRWTTRYTIDNLSGQVRGFTIEMDFRVAGRETIDVPAGKFDCFRVEGKGWGLEVNQSIDVTYWVAPGRLSRFVAREAWRRRQGRIVHSDRDELVSFTAGKPA